MSEPTGTGDMPPEVRLAWERAERAGFDDASVEALIDAQDRDLERRGVPLATRQALLERATARATAAGFSWRRGDYGTAVGQGAIATMESLGIGMGLFGDSLQGTAARMATGLAAPIALRRGASALRRWMASSSGGSPKLPSAGQVPTRAAPPSAVEMGYDGGWRVKWAGDPRALVAFERNGSGITVTDVFRGGNPQGSAGQMMADALRHPNVGIPKPTSIKVTSIIHKSTAIDLSQGIPPPATALGRTTSNAVRELGGTITGWTTGVYRGKPWFEATIRY